MYTRMYMVCGDCKKQQQNTLVILAAGSGELPGHLPCHHQQHVSRSVVWPG